MLDGSGNAGVVSREVVWSAIATWHATGPRDSTRARCRYPRQLARSSGYWRFGGAFSATPFERPFQVGARLRHIIHQRFRSLDDAMAMRVRSRPRARRTSPEMPSELRISATRTL